MGGRARLARHGRSRRQARQRQKSYQSLAPRTDRRPAHRLRRRFDLAFVKPKRETGMIDASEAVVWVNVEARLVMVWKQSQGCPDERGRVRCWTGSGHWVDPIGAAYSVWHTMDNKVRMLLMTETA